MIAKLIDLCIRNRVMVLILAAFVIAAGLWSVFHIKLDAIPDLSDTQVIVYTEYTGQAPKIVEDQVTYPLANAMLGVPKSKVVRGLSMFGVSFIYVIFEDGTDLNWARSRVLERLSFVLGKLPAGVTPQLGPDATGVGWVYEYALTTGKYSPDHPNGLWHDPQTDKWYADPADVPDQPDLQRRLVHHRVFDQAATVCPLDGKPLVDSQQTLANLRSLQDWYLRYELAGVPGVSEVASVGGFEKQYQILVDPVRLLAFNLPLGSVKSAVERSNQNVGGRVVEWSEREYAVEGIGYLGSLTDAEIAAARTAGKSLDEVRTEKVLADLRSISLGATPDGSPIYLRDVAEVRLGPEMRRGAIDWNGQGEAVGGVVVMRSGENARSTIELVRQRLATAERSLPPGVAVEVGSSSSRSSSSSSFSTCAGPWSP
jgi:Cu(I)/Ag(I) efflux system membrane protein CusA/SilA